MAVGGAAWLAKAIKGRQVVGFATSAWKTIHEFDGEADMPVTVAVDSAGTSVHNRAPGWQAKIGKIPVTVA